MLVTGLTELLEQFVYRLARVAVARRRPTKQFRDVDTADSVFGSKHEVLMPVHLRSHLALRKPCLFS